MIKETERERERERERETPTCCKQHIYVLVPKHQNILDAPAPTLDHKNKKFYHDCFDVDIKCLSRGSPGPLGQSYAPSDWYSGGRGFDPRSGHICFVEIWL